MAALKESFETMDVDMDNDLWDYILYLLYSKSESLSKLKYQPLFDLLDGKLTQGQLSVASDTQSRKRPESSSPEKLKARNKEKFQGNQEQKKKKEENYDDDNYEEEFEKLLDKDDEEEQDGEKEKNNTVKIKEQAQEEDEEGQEDEDDYIDEEEMLDVAERCFVRIAQAIINKGQTVRASFTNFIIKEDIEGTTLELLSPIGFLEGIKDLGIVDLEEVEVACLMRVLTKPNLENAILLKELIIIMENFGIFDEEDEDAEANDISNQQDSVS